MNSFVMNGYLWRVRIVRPNSQALIDRTNRLRVATTDPKTRIVYLSAYLDRGFRTRVLIHELGHCALFSYGLLDAIHRVVPEEYWIDAEEWVCNFIADYGFIIFRSAYKILGDSAISEIPKVFDKMIS